MEYRKSVLIIVADDVTAIGDWGILNDTFDIALVNGKSAAREYFQSGQKKTDAILLCVNQDVEDGYSLVEYINKDINWCGVPVLILADKYDAIFEQKFLTLGVWNYVVNPCEILSVKLRLLNAIERSMAKPLEKLRYLADYDVLTGIFNKKLPPCFRAAVYILWIEVSNIVHCTTNTKTTKNAHFIEVLKVHHLLFEGILITFRTVSHLTSVIINRC